MYLWGSSDCSELLWRLARVLCEKAKLSRDKKERETLMYEAYAVIQKALEKEPKDGCFGAHKWYAILLDYIGEIEGNKSRIQKSYEPGFYSTNTYYIGEAYEKMGNRDEAVKYYINAFKMPVITADDQAHDKLKRAGVKDSQLIQAADS
ncbi:unnamed protein product [Nippostrongylus brasiliensis]|uniref:Regulator of microtubule dynamics protein 1 (inferred by orthology to a human protein) n=1 Tax=Nippostrongylus brasiliensis TaxID=27835 RepID=A0A0N4Y4D8_NIPBR|nr:unnamed protein product [Nippostrongylus brasiliensis]